MRAVVISRFGGPEVLELREVADPVPARGEVRIRVRATAVNRADLAQRVGRYPAPPDAPQDIPGLEYAGEIESLGDGVDGFSIGDHVFGLCGGGAYAERVVVHAATVARIPEGLSFAEAAAVPEAFVTAYDAMVTQARLSAGETVLVSAVGSGVGTAAVQIARAIGARALGSARTPEKLPRAVALGLDHPLHVDGAPAFADEVIAQTRGQGIDVVLELVGGAYVAEDLRCVAPRGRIVLVGLVGGARADLDLGLVLRKRIELRGTVLRSRPLDEKIAAGRLLSRHLVPLFERGQLRPVVDAILPLADAAEAHARLERADSFGKLVLSVG